MKFDFLALAWRLSFSRHHVLYESWINLPTRNGVTVLVDFGVFGQDKGGSPFNLDISISAEVPCARSKLPRLGNRICSHFMHPVSWSKHDSE